MLPLTAARFVRVNSRRAQSRGRLPFATYAKGRHETANHKYKHMRLRHRGSAQAGSRAGSVAEASSPSGVISRVDRARRIHLVLQGATFAPQDIITGIDDAIIVV